MKWQPCNENSYFEKLKEEKENTTLSYLDSQGREGEGKGGDSNMKD